MHVDGSADQNTCSVQTYVCSCMSPDSHLCAAAASYQLQYADSMTQDEYDLVALRLEMTQSRGDALPGMSLFNKADGYWLPLRQVQ